MITIADITCWGSSELALNRSRVVMVNEAATAAESVLSSMRRRHPCGMCIVQYTRQSLQEMKPLHLIPGTDILHQRYQLSYESRKQCCYLCRWINNFFGFYQDSILNILIQIEVSWQLTDNYMVALIASRVSASTVTAYLQDRKLLTADADATRQSPRVGVGVGGLSAPVLL